MAGLAHVRWRNWRVCVCGIGGFYISANKLALQARWKPSVDALRCMKGVETVTALALACEVDGFSRFGSASRFASWLGLVPSESSSGERRCRGGITKAGNGHLRRLLVEAAWHYVNALKCVKISDTMPPGNPLS